MRIVYHFEQIKSLLEKLNAKSNNLTDIVDDLFNLTCGVDGISDSFNTAKTKTISLLEDSSSLLKKYVDRTITLCNDYLNFESKASSHSIFTVNNDVKTTTAPGLSDINISVGSAEYSVVKGDTLSEVASDYNVTLDELLAANPNIKNMNVIEVGDTVIIPGSVSEKTSDSDKELDDTKVENQNSFTHTVVKGDTLSEVASDYNVTLDELLAANLNIENMNVIEVGDNIVIPNSNGNVNSTNDSVGNVTENINKE